MQPLLFPTNGTTRNLFAPLTEIELREQSDVAFETEKQKIETSDEVFVISSESPFSPGQRVRAGKEIQPYVILALLPSNENEAELREIYYSVQNEKTKEIQTIEASDLKLLKK